MSLFKPAEDTADRLWRHISPEPNTGCWLWTADTVKGGYGRIYLPIGKRLAHRVSYEVYVGPIANGLIIDHLCRQRACVNPQHLEPVTYAMNAQRGMQGMCTHPQSVINRNKRHCKRGHEYTPENTYWKRNRQGRPCRSCRTCELERAMAQNQQRRAARQSGASR